MSKRYEIRDRIFIFVTRGLKVIRYIPSTLEGKIVINQYVRALTSVGANDNEADGALTKKRLYSLLYNCQKRIEGS